MVPQRPNPLHLATTAILVLLVLTLWAVRIDTEIRSSARAIGVTFDEIDGFLELGSVSAGGAAARAGLEVGDRILQIDDWTIRDFAAYNEAAARFVNGQAVEVRIERQDQWLTLPLVPGREPYWSPHAIDAFVTLSLIALGLLALLRRGQDLRARLIAAFFFLLAVEMAMPKVIIGDLRLDATITSLFLLITGAQMAVQLHLASVTPDRHLWLRRFPGVVFLYYLFGLGFGLVGWITFVSETTHGQTPFPWSYDQLNEALNSVILPFWAATVISLLALPTFRHPTSRGRQQAGLVLLGVLPWGIYVASSTVIELLGRTSPLWVNEYFSLLVLLPFPVAVAISIYRYHLFDIELVVRRSFLYTALTSCLVLIFYLALGALGTLFSKVVDQDEYSLWTLAAAMFVVGLLFGNLRRFLQHTIDRLFFPEQRALRQSLVSLASELPARGTIAAMGQHLVERIDDIFPVRSTSLLLVDPKSGNLASIATSQPREDRSSLSLLVPADDPSLELLRREARPLPADQALEASPALDHRFEAFGLEPSLLAPLMANDRLVGLLVLGKRVRGRRISREEIELLSLLTHQIATAFENIRLFESATYESLTGLLRREAILELLDREIERAQRYGRPLVVGMADLDFFKSVNDQHGHLAGDAVLRRVAEELDSGIRSTDAVGRYGGEEFLLVLPETQLEGGHAVAEKLRRRIEALSLPMDDDTRIDPSISIGLAEMPAGSPQSADVGAHLDDSGEEGSGAEGSSVIDSSTDVGRDLAAAKLRLRQEQRRRLIESADRALYRAKREGRNRVEIAPVDERLAWDSPPQETPSREPHPQETP